MVVDETRSAPDPRRHDGQAVAMASSTTFEDASLTEPEAAAGGFGGGCLWRMLCT